MGYVFRLASSHLEALKV